MFKYLVSTAGVALLLFTAIHAEGQDFLRHKNVSAGINGEAPSLAADGSKVYMSFASGDSIFYSSSANKGKNFSSPVLVTILDGLVNEGGRGPQIAALKDRLIIAAPDTAGNLHTWIGNKRGTSWREGPGINDIQGVAKEGFISIAVSGDGYLFAVWLDLRNGGKNNIYGARSINEGRSWQKSQLIYKSPDGLVCDCCKPSLAVKSRRIAVMFRNNLSGNRDLYLIQSGNGGGTFGKAEKLGYGSWKLDGCPMDGGALLFEDDATIRTVWQRDGNVYMCGRGQKETWIAKGRSCVIGGNSTNYFIAFVNKGILYYRDPGGKITELGKSSGYPKLIPIGKQGALCAWQSGHTIYREAIGARPSIH